MCRSEEQQPVKLRLLLCEFDMLHSEAVERYLHAEPYRRVAVIQRHGGGADLSLCLLHRVEAGEYRLSRYPQLVGNSPCG